MSSSAWQLPPANLSLHRGTIDLWLACADQPQSVITSCEQLLNPEEIERAQRFYFVRHKRRFTVARAYLRSTLSQYLLIPPEQLIFEYSSHGKPSLLAEQNPQQLTFNLSHSDEWILLGITKRDELGVDIEHFSERCEMGIAKRFFAPEEVEQLAKLPEDQHQASFFHIWTQKEAFIKAIGEGLSYPLDEFIVSVSGDAALHGLKQQPQQTAEWQLRSIETIIGFEAALAIQHPIEKLNYYINSHDLSKL